MKILLLGGTRDALSIAESLIAADHTLIYSIAGVAGTPEIDCEVRVGGFGGRNGLVAELTERRIDLLIDATHPYAATISAHARYASAAAGIPLYRYNRPPWQAQPGDHWIDVDNDWPAVAAAIAPYRRPFFTIGNTPLDHVNDIRSEQEWLVRTLAAHNISDSRIHIISARGPFKAEGERALMRLSGVDVLIAKNSGGSAVAAKIEVARELGIPVVLLKRPLLEPVSHEFTDTAALVDAVTQRVNSS